MSYNVRSFLFFGRDIINWEWYEPEDETLAAKIYVESDGNLEILTCQDLAGSTGSTTFLIYKPSLVSIQRDKQYSLENMSYKLPTGPQYHAQSLINNACLDYDLTLGHLGIGWFIGLSAG